MCPGKVIHRKFQRGMGLIHVAILIATMGGFLALQASWLNQQFSKERVVKTEDRRKILRLALVKYYRLNKVFPCPAPFDARPGDKAYGVAQSDPKGTCTSKNGDVYELTARTNKDEDDVWVGTVPIRDLDLPAEYMIDGWANRYIYAVSESMVVKSAGPSVGHITVETPDGEVLTRTAAYLLFSQGPKGGGTYSYSGVKSGLPCGYDISESLRLYENCEWMDDDPYNDNTIFISL